MSLLDFFRRPKADSEPRLLGCWHVIRVDGTSLEGETVEIEFRPAGQMIRSIKVESTWQISVLTYHVEGPFIVLGPQKRTAFAFEPGNILRLDNYEQSAWYKRGPKEAPEPASAH